LFSLEGISYLVNNPRVKVILMMVVYMISPIDLLPEALLGPIGLVDDSLVMVNLVRQVSGLLINFVGQESVREGNRNR
jgi:uncharacterized membrane protein YkvA (DUF1232 family)